MSSGILVLTLEHSFAPSVSMFSRRAVVSIKAEGTKADVFQLAEAAVDVAVKGKGSSWKGVRWASDV